MNFVRYSAIVAVAFSALSTTAAQADVVNFDEFTSPPVTCCYGGPVTGPLIYTNVTIKDGANSGYVMNSSGWGNMQTSGANLFGTRSGSMSFTFNTGVSNLIFDLINGTSSALFTVSAYGASNNLLAQQSVSLSSWTSSGSVGHLTFGNTGIRSLQISGNDNFAVDTISFNVGSGAVPEPATWAMMIGGFGAIGGAMRYRRRKVSVRFA